LARGPIDETRAWTSLSLNLLVLPGLGSFLVGRRIAGVAQALVALSGAAMSLWWLILLSAQWARNGDFPIDGGDDFRVGVIGVIVFAAAWLWSLATGLAAVREARETKSRSMPGERKATGRTADFLVTGTDTGVGKTAVAAGLVLALRARGRDAVGFKPVETGVEPGSPADSALLARASGREEPLTAPLVSLREALAPAVAAERAGVGVDRDAIETRVRALRERHPSIVVEGAGGAAVPLAWGYTALDLAQRLRLPVVVVARPGLGTINHVWLTVEALRARNIPVAAVVLNGVASPPDLAEETNPKALARLLPDVRFLTLPRVDSADPWEVASRLASLLDPLLER
jgi:dethiobiotin synthetase